MSFISPVATDSNGNEKITGSQQTLGKDDFLQLMITKLQYQDPLEPMQDEDFVSQLAQFSSLEQMNNIAEAIETSNQWSYLQMQSMNNVMASGFIGKEVTADYSGVYYDGETDPNISYKLDQFARDLEFTITDEEGNTVARLSYEDVAAGDHTFEWDGKDLIGNTVEKGYYSVSVTATNAAGNEFTPSLKLVGVVEKIVYREGSAYLLVNGSELALGDIVSISQPETGESSASAEDADDDSGGTSGSSGTGGTGGTGGTIDDDDDDDDPWAPLQVNFTRDVG